MEVNSTIGPDDIVIRRVPPSRPDFVTHDFDECGIERPTSSATRPRQNRATKEYERALSCSWLKMTSPAELLANLRRLKDPIDPTGWRICCFRVGDIEELGDGAGGFLKVRHEPELAPPVDFRYRYHWGMRASETRGHELGDETMNATFTKMTKGYSLEKQDRWVIREVRSMKALRAKGHRDFKDLSDTQILLTANRLARIYEVGATYTAAN